MVQTIKPCDKVTITIIYTAVAVLKAFIFTENNQHIQIHIMRTNSVNKQSFNPGHTTTTAGY